jgi:sensor c-di-GMP phosphodiesterase-like protein
MALWTPRTAASTPDGSGREAGNGLLGLVGGAVAAVPVLALLGLALLSARDDLATDLQATATLALRNTEHVLDQALGDLDRSEELIGEPCTAQTVERLRRLVYESAVTREIGLFRTDLQVYCTNFGAAQAYPEPAVRERFPPEGLFLAVFQTEIMGERSVVVHRRTSSGSGANAVVAPREFRNDVLAQAFGARGSLRLILADGSVVAESPGAVPRGTPGYVSVVAGSSRLPVRLEASRPEAELYDLFLERAPRHGLVGLGLGVLAFSAFSRAMRRRLSLETELRTALRRGELEVHYQPVVALDTGRCTGAEALVRWRHPRLGLVRPELFIAMAEETGLVVPMTSWMLRRIRDDLVSHFPGRQDFHVGVNLVAQHFQDERIVREVETVLAGSGLDPSVLMLEVTERQLVDDRGGVAQQVMARLRGLGCSLAIDDFGTGQSSLAYLQRFHMDYLKVDKAFVDTIGTDSLSRPVLDAVIDLGHRLDMDLIAEGVEQPYQAIYLRERGVAYAQGYHFSPPMPVVDLARFAADPAAHGRTGQPPLQSP